MLRVTKIAAAVLTTLLICIMTLGAMFILIRATLSVISFKSPLMRGIAFAAELVLGVVLLLGTVWLATHLAVRIFAPPREPGDDGPGAGQ